jgi:hypothetical protein
MSWLHCCLFWGALIVTMRVKLRWLSMDIVVCCVLCEFYIDCRFNHGHWYAKTMIKDLVCWVVISQIMLFRDMILIGFVVGGICRMNLDDKGDANEDWNCWCFKTAW